MKHLRRREQVEFLGEAQVGLERHQRCVDFTLTSARSLMRDGIQALWRGGGFQPPSRMAGWKPAPREISTMPL